VLIVATVGATLLLSQLPGDASLIPLMLMAMILAIAFNPPFALLVSFSMSVVICVSSGAALAPLLIQSGGMATAILSLRGIRSRTRTVEVGIASGFAVAAMTVAAGVLTDHSGRLIALDALRNTLWCLMAGFILSGTLPFVERWFGVVTDASLLELADGSHPLLQELVCRAPGTYTHSMAVATLAEAAAETIGANALLARVASYYHDIGKMMKPDYFVENQSGENRHDNLEPALSTLVILGHVKDGVALARQYGLPRLIIDFIQQHHGTTLVEYFYREAMRLQEENGHGCNELEFAFRYPGPKPRSREAGILMLADAVESASRVLASPTPTSLRKLVHEMMMKRLLDGQFDDSRLSLTELYQIEESLVKSLTAVYHARIRYPIENAKAG
jgi:putative nucleotidyltransferase with HDIG domain